MAGLWDNLGSLFGGGGSTALAGGGKSSPAGLFDMFGGEDYDLGSRLMMLGAHLEGNPQAAAGIMHRMVERKESRREAAEKRRKEQRIIEAMVSKRPELREMLQENPELAMFYLKKEGDDEYAIHEERRKQEVEQQKLIEQRKYAEQQEALKPENVYRRAFEGDLSKRYQQAEEEARQPWAQTPTSPPDMSLFTEEPAIHAFRRQPGKQAYTDDEANTYLSIIKAGGKPSDAAQEVSRMRDDVIQRAQAEAGGYNPMTGLVVPGINTGRPVTEREHRGGVLAQSSEGLDFTREEFEELRGIPATLGSAAQESDSAIVRLGGQYLQSEGAQKAFNGIVGLAQNEVFNLSGATASVREFERLIRQLLPNSADYDANADQKWNRIQKVREVLASGSLETRREYEGAMAEFFAKYRRPPTKEESASIAAEIVMGKAERAIQETGQGFQLTPERQNLLDMYAPGGQ